MHRPCKVDMPNVGRYYGEKAPAVYVEVDLMSESALSFTIYLISPDWSDDQEDAILKPVFGQIPLVSYTFDPLKCEITLTDQLLTEASVSYLHENRVELFTNLAPFYERIIGSLPEFMREQLPDEMTASIDSNGFLVLMNMLLVEPTEESVDWQSKVSAINRLNDINTTMVDLPLLKYDISPNRSTTRPVVFFSWLLVIMIFSV